MAAIATVTGQTYERIAKVLGFESDQETGFLIASPWPGLSYQAMVDRLSKRGLKASEISPSKLAALPHISAVISIEVKGAEWKGETLSGSHCLVYSDGLLFDLRYAKLPGVPLKDTDITTAYTALVPRDAGAVTAVYTAFTFDELTLGSGNRMNRRTTRGR